MARFSLFIIAVTVSIISSYWMPWLIPFPINAVISLPLGTLLVVFFLCAPTSSLFWLAGLGLGLDIFNAPAVSYQLAELSVAWLVLSVWSAVQSGTSWWWRVAAGTLVASAAYFIVRIVLSLVVYSSSLTPEVWRLMVPSLVGHAAGAFLLIGSARALRMRMRVPWQVM